MNFNRLRAIGVYIYIPEAPFDGNYLHYAATVLSEGLVEIGVPVFSNLAIPGASEHEIGLKREHVYVFCVTERNYSDAFMRGIETFAAPWKLILSMADTTSTIVTPASVPSLMAHENIHWQIHGNRKPWAIGLSRFRISQLQPSRTFAQRKPRVLSNFRRSFRQSVREMLCLGLYPLIERCGLELDTAISDGAGHFDRLGSYAACFAYGGEFTPDYRLMSRANSPDLVEFCTNHVRIDAECSVLRWDSWRFWESLASGCLTFHLDFERYGFRLPVMPKPWVHYVPLNLSDLKGTIDECAQRKVEWSTIAEQGRAWALAHYSPKPTAERFVDSVTS